VRGEDRNFLLRIKENSSIFDFAMSVEDISAIGTLDMKTRRSFDHRDPAITKWLGTKKLEE
jgi:diketogulonate reductase-like aldo/keto reductase